MTIGEILEGQNKIIQQHAALLMGCFIRLQILEEKGMWTQAEVDAKMASSLAEAKAKEAKTDGTLPTEVLHEHPREEDTDGDSEVPGV
jgi:hypothetical protein